MNLNYKRQRPCAASHPPGGARSPRDHQTAQKSRAKLKIPPQLADTFAHARTRVITSHKHSSGCAHMHKRARARSKAIHIADRFRRVFLVPQVTPLRDTDAHARARTHTHAHGVVKRSYLNGKGKGNSSSAICLCHHRRRRHRHHIYLCLRVQGGKIDSVSSTAAAAAASADKSSDIEKN